MSKPRYQIEAHRQSIELSAFPVGMAPNATPTQAMRRVLFIAYQFPPNMEMGARSCGQIARYLPQHGWSPVVLTVREKYVEDRYRDPVDVVAGWGLPDAVIRTGMTPHPLDFYRWFVSAYGRKSKGNDEGASMASDSVNKVDVPMREKGALRRLALSLLSIPDLCTGWIFPAILAGLKAIRQSRAEQIFSSGPFWTNHLVGFGLSFLTGLPWTAHFRDPWVAGSWEGDATALTTRLNKWLERMIVTRATAVVSVTEEHAAAFQRIYPHLPADKFTSVPNGFDSGEWENLPTRNQRDENSANKFLITYTGSFYVQRDPQPLFRALKTLIEAGEALREQIQVDLIGWCETSEGRSVSQMVAGHGLTNCVNLLGTRGRPETLQRTAQADLLLLLAERYTIQIPGKTYEYLRSGRPILALTPEGSLANLLRRVGGGWVVDPTDDAGILAAVRESFQQWKEGRVTRVADPAIVADFDRRVLSGQLAALFDRLLKQIRE